MPHYCGQPPEKRRQFTREYFRSSPLGSSPSRVASLLLLQSRMPPALVVEQGFSLLSSRGQGEAVVSAMNRSASAMSSSIAQQSSSNRARLARKSAISVELADSAGPTACHA